MHMGSVCGAITGGFIVLGLAGVDDTAMLNEYYMKLSEARNGMMHGDETVTNIPERIMSIANFVPWLI